MAFSFKLSFESILLVIVGVALIVLWARSKPSCEGFEDAVEGASENPWKFNMYYVDWCPHCHAAKPKFEKLGAIQTIGGKKIACNAIEAEKNPEKVLGKVSGYPTFQLYDASGKLVQEYQGERNEPGFRSFLEDIKNRL
jgi:thiol-disulfide isomerase/thioredoxin